MAKASWIKKAIGKPGSLHRELGIPDDHKIPKKRLIADSKKFGKEGKRSRLALTLEGFHKNKKVHDV